MTRRGRRAPRGRARAAAPAGAPAKVHGKKERKREHALAEHRVREGRLKRMRTIVGFLGLVPLAGSLACDGGVLLACVPWSWYMALWAGVFGAFVGLSIRLVRERRKFEAQQSHAT